MKKLDKNFTRSTHEEETMDTKMANDAMEGENKETIEQILRFYECDPSILVQKIVCLAGSKDGDNYMSVVKRLIVSGQHDKNQNQNGMYWVFVLSFFVVVFVLVVVCSLVKEIAQ